MKNGHNSQKNKKASSDQVKTELLEFSRLSSNDVLKKFNSKEKGLTEAEAQKRLKENGLNVLVKEKKLSAFLELLSKFKSPLLILLFVAAFISAFFGETTNAIIIFAMILASALLDYYEEHNADKSVEELMDKVKTVSTVIRGNKKIKVKVSQITLGDIVFLNSGDMIPADARVISAKDFFVNQSSLTGESMPAEKYPDSLKVSSGSLSELDNIVFAGTNVISGEATAVVVGIGANTEFGKISYTLVNTKQKSEFEIGIASFGYFIMKIILFLVLFIFLFNAFIHHQILDSFLFAVAIAVGVTPELLPMIMSITMARGSIKMAAKGAIVKKLSAIPSFGSLDILCTDKTGTLTEGKISLVKHLNVLGETSPEVLRWAFLNSSFQTGIENPLDNAVIEFQNINIKGVKKIDEIPFDFMRKMMSVVVEEKGERLLISKGAPEEIFSASHFYYDAKGKILPFNKTVRAKALKFYEDLSADGYRVLALAVKKITVDKKVYNKDEESSLVLGGFIAFLDPPKHDLRGTLEELEAIGIEIKIITGDNELVTNKICQEIKLPVKGILLGKDIEALTMDALRRRVENTTIFARFSPIDKNRVIAALRANGHVVGYLGDGINDAPSLKTADVGISVNNAVDVAKAAADIVLMRKNLRVLKDGVLEGRRVFGNTMKYIMMGLSSNFGNMFSAAGAVIFLPFLPMLPIQILLNNFIYDISQITIPTDNVDEEWTKKAHRWDLGFIKRFMIFIGPISSLFDFTTFFLLYFVFHASASVFQTGWFVESLATQTLVIHFIRTKKIPFFQSRASWPLLVSTFSAVTIGWILPFTPVGKFFGFAPLPAYMLWAIVGIVVVYLFLVEVGKRIFYKHNDF